MSNTYFIVSIKFIKINNIYLYKLNDYSKKKTKKEDKKIKQ